MRISMLNRKSLLLVVVIVSLVVAAALSVARWGTNDLAQAQGPPRLQGAYAVATAAGSPTEGTIGRLVANADGTLSGGVLILNVPTSVIAPGAPGRTTLPATVTSGSYTLGPNGIGSADAMISIPGQTLVRTFGLLASRVDGSVVTEAYLSQAEPTLGGGLGFFVLTRVSD